MFCVAAASADMVIAIAARRVHRKHLGAHGAMATIVICRPSAIAGGLTRNTLNDLFRQEIILGEVGQMTQKVGRLLCAIWQHLEMEQG